MKLASIFLFGLALPSVAAVSFTLPGNTEEAVWAGLDNVNYNSGNGYPTSNIGGVTPPGPWGPIDAGSGSSASLSKTSGPAYFFGAGIYGNHLGGASNFVFADASPLAGMETLVLQMRMAGTPGYINSVTLSLNGGEFSGIAANYFLITDSGGEEGDDHAWQWDLSGYGEITSYELTLNTNQHTVIYSSAPVSIITGDTFQQVIPEPSTFLAALTGLVFTFTRRRRA